MTGTPDERAEAKRAAAEVEERNRGAFAERGGRLRVRVVKATNLRPRTQDVELAAEVEWGAARAYDHVHVKLLERRWFSRDWRKVRSLKEAIGEIEATLANWLR